MAKSIFLSHNWNDKPFARRLAADLSDLGVRVWLDEAEIQLGDSLIEKIRSGIDEVDFVAVILSPDSVQSSWVQHEIDVAMNQEIEGKSVKVLPLLYRKCELPGFLKGKLYADFSDDSKYQGSLGVLLRRLEVNELKLGPAEWCQWRRVFAPEGCDRPAEKGIAFCITHVEELERRAIYAMQHKLRFGHEEDIKCFIVAILTAAGTIGAQILVRHWDFIWHNIFIGGMFPPGFYWGEGESDFFLGRPSPEEQTLVGYGCEPMDAGPIVDELLQRLPG